MTDLQINVALAKAMGWAELSSSEFWNTRKTGAYAETGNVWCYDFLQSPRPKVFDYRDPVVFVAICKHWRLDISHQYKWAHGDKGVFIAAGFGTIEKAAALCAIALAKRGVK